VNRRGVLLDTGPLVALLAADDGQHEEAKRLFALCEPPLRTCEAVLAEACFLLQRHPRHAQAEVLAVGRKGLYEVAFSLDDHLDDVEHLLAKYRDRPISLADACLIRCAEIHDEPRILTFDSDFKVYRWNKRRAFQRLGA
jgi:predicted nucleic acid-binding protein